MRVMERTCIQRMVPRTTTKPLQMIWGIHKKDRANQNSGYSRILPSKVQDSNIIYKSNSRQSCSEIDGSSTKYDRSDKDTIIKNQIKEIQKLSTIFTYIAASKLFESRSDKQLTQVEKIFPDNSMEKHNNSPYYSVYNSDFEDTLKNTSFFLFA